MSPTSDIWTIILLLYLSFCWPYLNFPLIYCPLRMSPRALFVSVMWAPSRNGAVNIQWVHQNPWREIKRRKKLRTIWRKGIRLLWEKNWIWCVMSVWSHNEVVCILWEQTLILLSLLFAGINITCSVFQFKVDRFREKFGQLTKLHILAIFTVWMWTCRVHTTHLRCQWECIYCPICQTIQLRST